MWFDVAVVQYAGQFVNRPFDPRVDGLVNFSPESSDVKFLKCVTLIRNYGIGSWFACCCGRVLWANATVTLPRERISLIWWRYSVQRLTVLTVLMYCVYRNVKTHLEAAKFYIGGGGYYTTKMALDGHLRNYHSVEFIAKVQSAATSGRNKVRDSVYEYLEKTYGKRVVVPETDDDADETTKAYAALQQRKLDEFKAKIEHYYEVSVVLL